MHCTQKNLLPKHIRPANCCFSVLVQQKFSAISCHQARYLGSKFTHNALAAGALSVEAEGAKVLPQLPSLFEGERGSEEEVRNGK